MWQSLKLGKMNEEEKNIETRVPTIKFKLELSVWPLMWHYVKLSV
jgi:hypothetical protein